MYYDACNQYRISKKNWILTFFIDIYSKYALFIPSKDKKGITITNAFQKIVSQRRHG